MYIIEGIPSPIIELVKKVSLFSARFLDVEVWQVTRRVD